MTIQWLAVLGLYANCFFALAALWYVVRHDRASPEPAAAISLIALYGGLAVGLAWLVAQLTLSGRSSASSNVLPPTNVTTASLFGFGAELVLILPLIGFVRGRRWFNEHTDGVIYFAVAGFVFAVVQLGFVSVRSDYNRVVHWLPAPLIAATLAAAVGAAVSMYQLTGRQLFKLPVWLVAVAAALLNGGYAALTVQSAPLVNGLLAVVTLAAAIGLVRFYRRAVRLDTISRDEQRQRHVARRVPAISLAPSAARSVPMSAPASSRRQRNRHNRRAVSKR